MTLWYLCSAFSVYIFGLKAKTLVLCLQPTHVPSIKKRTSTPK
ncbi:hypothetical protein Plhal304r1_c051g0135151 [Plasmopara halstedii]